jgi:VWFA-related protein
MLRWLASGLLVSGLIGALAAQQQEPPPTLREPQGGPEQRRGTTAAQQRPVFRGGTHFVRVDAYPTQDGKIVENLKPEDFEVLEDGRPQQIDSFDFVRFDTFTPDAARRDPSTQREGFDMAADPRYRVFVIFVDMVFSGNTDIWYIQQPLVQFLDRILGPQDLFGFLTSRNSAKDLVLGRKSPVIQSQITDMFRSANIDRDDADQLDGCQNGDALKARHRADATYSALEGLVVQLGSIRQERKNIVFVSNLLPRWRPEPKLLEMRGPVLPRAGITQGRIGIGDRTNVGSSNDMYCASEFQRLANMDFDERFRQLLREARRDNVSFYNVTPAGLQAPATIAGIRAVQHATDSLISLANETDGMAIVNTNDLRGGMKRIADDLAAYYVLGYYTTNTKFDGRVREIKVRLKSSGKAVRARRQYRAPTEAEIAALSGPASSTGATASPTGPSPVQAALAALEERAQSQKADTPAGALIGEPVVFRLAPRMPLERVTLRHFDRTDRIRIEWPILGATERREVRLLDRTGRPLPVDVPLAEDPVSRGASVSLPLAALARGDYLIELTAVGAVIERKLLALRVK